MPCPSDDTYYAPLFKGRNIGSETYYKKGAYKLNNETWIHCYIDHNKYKRLTLTIKGIIVSGLQVDRQNVIKKKATLASHAGNRYTNILQGLAPIYFGFNPKASD